MISDRHRLTLPSVRISVRLSSFIARTASTASPVTNRVFTQVSGSVRVEEKTTFEIPLSSSTPSSRDGWVQLRNRVRASAVRSSTDGPP